MVAGCRCDGLIWPHLATRRDGCDGLNWPHLTVISVRIARTVVTKVGLEGEVEGGAVRGDPPGSSGRGVVDPGAGGQASVCTGARCGRRWSRRSRRRARRRRGSRRGWSRSRPRSTRCCAVIWMRRRSSGIPRGGCWPGWSMSTARRACRIRRCVTMSASAARRSSPRRAGRWRWGSCRRPIRRRPRRRSTSTTCGWCCAG